MEEFLKSNSGLASRFDVRWHLEDYKPQELIAILEIMAERENYELTEGAFKKALSFMGNLYEKRGENFANGREVRKLFERIKTNLSDRVLQLPEEKRNEEAWSTIKAEDVPVGEV